jgi:hypothetical protein
LLANIRNSRRVSRVSVSPRSGRNGARNERSEGLREAQLTREGRQPLPRFKVRQVADLDSSREVRSSPRKELHPVGCEVTLSVKGRRQVTGVPRARIAAEHGERLRSPALRLLVRCVSASGCMETDLSGSKKCCFSVAADWIAPGVRSIFKAITRVGVFPFANARSCWMSAGVHGWRLFAGALVITCSRCLPRGRTSAPGSHGGYSRAVCIRHVPDAQLAKLGA